MAAVSRPSGPLSHSMSELDWIFKAFWAKLASRLHSTKQEGTPADTPQRPRDKGTAWEVEPAKHAIAQLGKPCVKSRDDPRAHGLEVQRSQPTQWDPAEPAKGVG
ncbi:Hypothetical predicted protein [Pelobates cultripes]|uniref:Uncharacterized protein n=1 Tax=Pelobates cultripes TaxID=61616 RepID=A0AAD1R1E3_PELCU|nr:Hypothetical predicted protein [Pelobates cultripes]